LISDDAALADAPAHPVADTFQIAGFHHALDRANTERRIVA